MKSKKEIMKKVYSQPTCGMEEYGTVVASFEALLDIRDLLIKNNKLLKNIVKETKGKDQPRKRNITHCR